MTKKRMLKYLDIYRGGYGKNHIFECYKKPSYEKQHAFNRCVETERNFSSKSYVPHNGKILTFNTFMFTYGFIHGKSLKEKYFSVITPNGIHTIKI